MAKDLTDLKGAFDEVLDLFNRLDYETLASKMDPDIITKRVLNPGSIVGIGNVQAYLIGRMKPLQPRMLNLKDVTYYPSDQAAQANAMNAQVGGTADYHDKGSGPPTRVRFVWTFARKNNTEDWSLINAFAAPIG
jgi:hypothetical protein